MMNSVKTRAFANIALVKYWGKQTEGINCPATPSLSLTIDSLKTETSIERAENDGLVFNNVTVQDINGSRAFGIINDWRKQGLLDGSFTVDTKNGFPSGAGLASSASGVAALTVGLNRIGENALDNDSLVRLARQGSGSAARSMTGGLSVLPNDFNPIAKQIVPHDEVPWCIITAVTEMNAKKVGSREAMDICRRTSPYYQSWLKTALDDYQEMLDAVDKMDISHVGEIAEHNCLAMHACMWASKPPLVYWNGTTVEIIRAARKWRHSGLESYFTIDAGPQVCLLADRKDAETIASKLTDIPGVKKILIGYPAGGAEVTECR